MKEWEKNEIKINDEEDSPERPLPYPIVRAIEEVCKIFVEYKKQCFD